MRSLRGLKKSGESDEATQDNPGTMELPPVMGSTRAVDEGDGAGVQSEPRVVGEGEARPPTPVGRGLNTCSWQTAYCGMGAHMPLFVPYSRAGNEGVRREPPIPVPPIRLLEGQTENPAEVPEAAAQSASEMTESRDHSAVMQLVNETCAQETGGAVAAEKLVRRDSVPQETVESNEQVQSLNPEVTVLAPVTAASSQTTVSGAEQPAQSPGKDNGKEKKLKWWSETADVLPFMEESTRPLDEEDGAEGQSQSNRVVQVGGKEDARDEGVDGTLGATHRRAVQEEFPVEPNKQTLDHTSEKSTFTDEHLDVAVNAWGDHSAELNQSHYEWEWEQPCPDESAIPRSWL
ncbi:hypothetical protein MD484_g8640, partial [Candolleomyces efflorescens]